MNFYKISRTDLQNLIQSMKLQFWLIKTNLKNYLIRFIYIFVALVITVFSFSVPSFADSLTPLTIENQPIESYYPDPGWLYSLGTLSNSDIECTIVGSSDNKYYCFVYDNFAYFISESGSSDAIWVRGNGSNNTNFNLATLNSTYNLYYVQSQSVLTGYSSLYVPSFNSLDDGLAYIRNYIDNGDSSLPNDGFEGTLLIEAGYVAYIRVNGGNMELSATMNELSGLSLGGSPWGNTSSIAYGVSNLPSQGTTFPLNSMSHIPWMKKAEGQNWLGQTRYAGYPRSNLSIDDNYIVIYNPAQPYLSSKGQDELSPTITAKFSKLVDYKKYPLTQSYDSVTGGTSSNSISDFDDFYNGEADSNGSFSETPSNSSMSPVATPGGTGDLATSGQLSVTEYIQQVNNTLTNFAKSVIDLLKAPISHVGEIISAGSGFMSALRGLYAWLPLDIQGLVISALTVVIGIGVFKVFL